MAGMEKKNECLVVQVVSIATFATRKTTDHIKVWVPREELYAHVRDEIL